jgi:hypothetical protein
MESRRALGTEHVIDYTQEDFTRKRGKQRRRYDLLLAVSGYHSIFAYWRALRPNGRYVLAGASTYIFRALFQALLLGPMISRMGSRQLGGFIARPTQQDLLFVKELLEAGNITPVIDRRYSFSVAAEAIRYLEGGHATGKVVITVGCQFRLDCCRTCTRLSRAGARGRRIKVRSDANSRNGFDMSFRLRSEPALRGGLPGVRCRGAKSGDGMSAVVPTERMAEASPGFTARMAGAMYLLSIVAGVVAVLLVGGALVVDGDAVATASNILAHETLFQVSVASFLVGVACNVAVTALLYSLLRPVNRTLSLLAAFFCLVGFALWAVGSLFPLAALGILRDGGSSSGLTIEQAQALALTILNLYAQALSVGIVFFGFYCLLIGHLIFRSTFLPRVVGALMALTGLGYLTYLYPPLQPALSAYLQVTGLLGETSLTLCLLVVGVNAQRWKDQARAVEAALHAGARMSAGAASASCSVVLGVDTACGIKGRVVIRRGGYRPEHACARAGDRGRRDVVPRRGVEHLPLVAAGWQAVQCAGPRAVGLGEQLS